MESRDIQVTDYIYGKDLGVSNSSTYILGGLEDQNHITTRFEMYADEQLYGLRAYIGKPTDVQINEIVGAEVKAQSMNLIQLYLLLQESSIYC